MKGNRVNKLKYFVLVLAIFLSYHVVEAHDKKFLSDGLYESTKRDVTGDKKIDIIELTGTFSEKNRKWLKEMELVVESNHRTISVPLEAGYQPKLAIADFNKDGVQDVSVSIQKQDDSEPFNRIYSFKGEQVTNLDGPPPVPVTAQFQDYYIAEIMVEGQKPIKVDISSQRDVYEKLGIYHNGKLNEATELVVEPYSELTLHSSFGRGSGLSGQQLVKGVDGDDAIATISSAWTYKDGAWKLVKAKVKPLKKKK